MITGFTWALLLGGSYYDIKYRALPNGFLVIGGLLATVFAFLFQPVKLISVAGAIGLGAAILGVSALTRGGIGFGDGLFLGLLGINLGFFCVFSVFLIALFLSAIAAIILLLIKKKNRKYTFPFVPFLTMAYGIICFM